MNLFDFPLNLADLPWIGILAGLLLWSIAAVLVLLLVELVCFLWFMIRSMRSSHLTAGKAVTEKP
jgi:hypothetical protein